VSIEVSNRPELAREFVAQIGATFPIVNDDQNVAKTTYNLAGTPTDLLLDRQGRVFFRSLGYGPGYEERYRAEIEYLLARGGRELELMD
jgi:hypothetical protein